MLVVPYYSKSHSPPPGPACVRLSPDLPALQRNADDEVWLESFDPALVVEEARKGGTVTLNSLWLDDAYWESYAGTYGLFRRIVLMPYDPGQPDAPYESAVDRILETAVRRGLGPDRLVVDLCILPYGRCGELERYAARADRLRGEYGQALALTAGLDNVIHRERTKLPVLSALLRLLADRIDYGLISARYASWARLFTEGRERVIRE